MIAPRRPKKPPRERVDCPRGPKTVQEAPKAVQTGPQSRRHGWTQLWKLVRLDRGPGTNFEWILAEGGVARRVGWSP